MAEVKLGQLAQNKGSDPSVKDFGKRMEMDHSRANEQLKDVASRNKISLPGELNKTDQATVARLSKLSGPAFDKAYSAAMVADHQKDVAAFKKEAASGQNMDIKQFATQTLPTLQEHFKMAQDMERIASSGAVPPATPATR
jgi:putative membrane protein